jgi:CBS domain-containing protein
MQVQDLMTRDVSILNPYDNLETAAIRMAELDVGAFPVGEDGRLVGMITDRDIVVRGLAEGLDATARVKDVMTPEVKYCYADQHIGEISANMAVAQVRRLPVLDRNKRMVGILSLSDMAAVAPAADIAEALAGISRPAGDVILNAAMSYQDRNRTV